MKILVRENWLREPEVERENALSASYAPFEHTGVRYQGISPCPSPEQENQIRTILGAVGGSFTTFYRRYVAPELVEDDPKRWKLIHTDSEMGDVAGVLFLTAPEHCSGGLAFWRHKAYGFAATPTLEDLALRGLKDDARFWENMRLDGEDPSHWEMIDYVPMAFNRLVLFHASRFHSKWPKDQGSPEAQSARLIKAFFWRAKP